MENGKNEHYSKKDIEEQTMLERQIGEYQKRSDEGRVEELSSRAVDHLKILKKVEDEKEKALNVVRDMVTAEEEEHDAKLEAEKKKGREALVRTSHKMDGLTKETLDSLKEKGKELDDVAIRMAVETNQAKEKNKEQEVRASEAVFNEKMAQKEKNELVAERRQMELDAKDEEIRKAQLKAIQAEREQQKESNDKMVALRLDDVQNNQKFSDFNTAMLQNDCDRNNRAQINTKIASVKTLANEIVEFFDNVHGKLSLSPEHFAKLKKMQMTGIQRGLTRFSETTKKILQEIGCTEHQLAKLELSEVDKTKDFNDIKTKITEFSEVIAYLRTMVEIDERNIDQEKVKKLGELKDELYQMINNITPIPENRAGIQRTLDQLKDSTSKGHNLVERLRIEN